MIYVYLKKIKVELKDMICILGGIGTQAGLDFCKKLAKLNRGKTDPKHPLFILFNKSNVPERPENVNEYNNMTWPGNYYWAVFCMHAV